MHGVELQYLMGEEGTIGNFRNYMGAIQRRQVEFLVNQHVYSRGSRQRAIPDKHTLALSCCCIFLFVCRLLSYWITLSHCFGSRHLSNVRVFMQRRRLTLCILVIICTSLFKYAESVHPRQKQSITYLGRPYEGELRVDNI